jgi:hypothetical protein
MTCRPCVHALLHCLLVVCVFVYQHKNSYIGMLPSGCAVLYYLFDVQLFLQPQCIRKRGQRGSGVNWCVASPVAMAAGM